MMPNDLPPWSVICQQTRRWTAAGVFESIVHAPRPVLRRCADKKAKPTAAVIDSHTMRSTPESGSRAGYDGYKGSKVHAVVDTLGRLLALHVTPANWQERDQVARSAKDVLDVTGENVATPDADQGYTGRPVVADAKAGDTEWVGVGLKEARRSFVLLPRRWVVERSFA